MEIMYKGIIFEEEWGGWECFWCLSDGRQSWDGGGILGSDSCCSIQRPNVTVQFTQQCHVQRPEVSGQVHQQAVGSAHLLKFTVVPGVDLDTADMTLGSRTGLGTSLGEPLCEQQTEECSRALHPDNWSHSLCWLLLCSPLAARYHNNMAASSVVTQYSSLQTTPTPTIHTGIGETITDTQHI